MERREEIRNKKRVVIKVGTTTITHSETGNINLEKLEKFVRILINLRDKGKEVVVVSSGSVAVGKKVLGIEEKVQEGARKQACAAVGQGRLMMMYEKLFAEYSQLTAQILLTKETVVNEDCRENALYTDDPRKNPHAKFVHTVHYINEELENMGKGAGSVHGTGGMATKIEAAKVAMKAGVDMVIANGANIYTINDIMAGRQIGTLFKGDGHNKTGGKAYEVYGADWIQE